MPQSQNVPAAQSAVDRANLEIRAWVLGLPPYAQWTPAEKARYDQLLDAFNGARDRLREAAAREGDDEPAAVAA